MSPEDLARVAQILSTELATLTPGPPATHRLRNQISTRLSEEFITENLGLVDAGIRRARRPDGGLSPKMIDRDLLPMLVEHSRTRVLPVIWAYWSAFDRRKTPGDDDHGHNVD